MSGTEPMELLRARAEQVAGPAPAGRDASDALRQRHELEVTQIELDMQNVALAELRHRISQTERELAQYRRLHVSAPAGSEAAQLRLLAEHLAISREREREQVARIIHDELAQNLLALRIDIAMLNARTEGRQDRLHERTGQALAHLDHVIRSARGIINELRPPVMSLGLPASLEWLVGQAGRHAGARHRLTVAPERDWSAVDATAAAALFRMLQEALGNVRRHARASTVEVALDMGQGWIELSVSDDGVGIAAGQLDKPDAFGLRAIAERLEAAGGTLAVGANAAGQGCRLVMRMPLLANGGGTDAA